MTITIRDTIHSYIDFTELETFLIDTRIMQRLRHIRQNAFSFYTYPTCQTNRFEHSLGVMKIGSIIIKSLLHNTDKQTMDNFLSRFRNMVNYYEKKQVYEKLDRNRLREDLTEGVEIACLLHDVGHFPFSHLVEEIFKEGFQSKSTENNPYVKDADFVKEWQIISTSDFSLKLHELTTYLLIKQSKEIKEICSNNERYKRLINIALLILNPEKELLIKIKKDTKLYYEMESVISPLRMILDSEMDADRFDYLSRDSVNSGVTSGDFDIERVLSTIVLRKLNQNRLYFYLCPSMKSLSSVESFYIERTKAYNWFIHHHNSVFYNRLCSFILLKLMNKESILYRINNYIAPILPIDALHYKNFNGDIPVNDIFLLEKLYKLYNRVSLVNELLKSKSKKIKLNKRDRSFLDLLRKCFRTSKSKVEEDIKRIKIYFEILLFRKRKKLSIWKNISDYKEANEKIYILLQKYLNEVNSKTVNSSAKKLDMAKIFESRDFILNEIADKYLGWDNMSSLQEYFLTPVRYNLNNEGVIFFSVVPFDPIGMRNGESKLKLYCPTMKKIIPVNQLSPMIESICKYKEERIKLFASLILINKEKPLSRDEADIIRSRARDRFVNSLVLWLTGKCEQFKKELEEEQKITNK